jgi:branched-chain amino acid transport system ATP-binding protein
MSADATNTATTTATGTATDDVAQYALAVRGIEKRFGTLQTLRGIDMSVRPGEKRALIGPNGAGKTSLFNIIGGQWRASAGHVWVFGRNVDRYSPHRRARLGVARTFQITNLFKELTVEDNVKLALLGLRRSKLNPIVPRALDQKLTAEAEDVLERGFMLPRRAELVKNLSYGQQRILEVLVALAAKPRILLLDEPTAGLSPHETERMVQRIQALGEGLTLVVIEHDMDVCFQIVDTITVLHHGTVLADGTKDEVKENPAVQEIYLGATA